MDLGSQWSRCAYHLTIKSFFDYLIEFDHRIDDPMRKLKAPKSPRSLPKPVSEEELATALSRLDPMWQLVVTLAAYGGLRRGDIAALRREDVTESSITIRAGKGGRDAVVPTHPRIWAMVEPMPPGPLIRKRTGQRADANWLGSLANYHFHRIGMPDLHLHRFRHRFATVLLRDKERGGAGANLRVVQELMRHSSPATTARYTLVTVDELRGAIGGL
jgi:integrase